MEKITCQRGDLSVKENGEWKSLGSVSRLENVGFYQPEVQGMKGLPYLGSLVFYLIPEVNRDIGTWGWSEFLSKTPSEYCLEAENEVCYWFEGTLKQWPLNSSEAGSCEIDLHCPVRRE